MPHGSSHFSSARVTKKLLWQHLLERSKGVSPREQGLAGVAIASKSTHTQERKPWILRPFVLRSEPGERLAARLPTRFDGMEVQPLFLPGLPRLSFGPPGRRLFDTLSPGCSISRENGPCGTLGAFLTDGSSLYLASTSHVLGGPGAQAGDPIYQAASTYATPGTRPIASFVDGDELKPTTSGEFNLTDFAFAEVYRGLDWSAHVKGVGLQHGGRIRPCSSAREKLRKYGQATGFTAGWQLSPASSIELVDPRTNVAYSFDNQILLFRKHPKFRTTFASNGDSGAFIWDPQGKAIGMIIGAIGSMVVATPWREIENAFKHRVLDQRTRGIKPRGASNN